MRNIADSEELIVISLIVKNTRAKTKNMSIYITVPMHYLSAKRDVK
jgi:hypothetical protein